MKQTLLVVAALVVVASAQNNSTSQLKCYFCESIETPECKKQPMNTLQVSCDELDYGDTITRGASTQSQNKILKDVFNRETSRSVYAKSEYNEFRCITVDLDDNGQKNFIRTCAPVRPTVANTCDFIRENVEKHIKIKDCIDCNEEFCNSASTLGFSWFQHFATVAVVWVLAKY